jgi:hypothetical protein
MGAIKDASRGELRRRLLPCPLVAGLIFLGVSSGFAEVKERPPGNGRESLAQARYTVGVDLYARGEFSQALVAFQDAVRLDPRDRSARAAVNRVQMELGRRVQPGAPVWRTRPKEAESEGGGPLLEVLVGLLNFERAVGDPVNDQGAQQAKLGRIAQLLGERRVSRARGLSFAREEELHALSRRLPTLLS